MTRSSDQDEDDWDAGDAESDDEWDDSDGEPTVPCPFCRRDILEDCPQCPFCRTYLPEEDHPGRKRPAWVIVTAVICLGIAIWWAVSA